MKAEYSAVVIGGGTAGVVAAVQLGRAGARTLLIEKNGILGGTMTVGGVSLPGLFHAWGEQVVAGIGWELVSRCVSEDGGALPDFSDYRRPHYLLQIPINPWLYAALCDDALLEAGVDILLHSMPARLTQDSERGWTVTVCTKGGLRDVVAAVVVDATGDANAASLAGVSVSVPEQYQPATLKCRTSGYDPDRLDIDAINAAFESEVLAGRLESTDASWKSGTPDVGPWLRAFGGGTSHVAHRSVRHSDGRTTLELEARKRLLRLYRFLSRQPGLENLTVEHVSAECGVRESCRIRGRSTVRLHDYVSGRVWEDAVCNSFYPIDLHTVDGSGLDKRELAEGTVPTVPRGALIPDDGAFFVAAGRCISSDRAAGSALRTQATCMATGQAAGAMAALSASSGVDPAMLPLEDVRALLRDHGAVVPV